MIVDFAMVSEAEISEPTNSTDSTTTVTISSIEDQSELVALQSRMQALSPSDFNLTYPVTSAAAELSLNPVPIEVTVLTTDTTPTNNASMSFSIALR